jgi:pSer/pThr/pTyr-binding forkhead associated (FHA) protein
VVRVEDMGSVNGTLLNGKKVRGVEYVRPGDTLTVGPVTFVVEYVPTPSAIQRLMEPEEEAVEDQAEMLELLADGEVLLEAEDLPVLEMAEEDYLPSLESEHPALPAEDEDAPLQADFELDDPEPWQMPDGNDFRDMLSQLEDEDGPPGRK